MITTTARAPGLTFEGTKVILYKNDNGRSGVQICRTADAGVVAFCFFSRQVPGSAASPLPTTRHARITTTLTRRNMSSDSKVVLPDGREPATARGGTRVPDNVLRAIYGDTVPSKEGAADTATAATTTTKSKAEQYDESLKTWWKEYADRKNDEEEEHVSDSLLYDYTHLPRMAPAPNLKEDRLHHVHPEHRKE